MSLNKKLAEIIQVLGLEKFTLVDVGVAEDFNNCWRAVGDYLFAVGFEPNKEEFDRLNSKNKKNSKYYNCCLAEKPSQINFFLNQEVKCSSCLKPNYKFLKRFPWLERFNLVKQISMQAESLDHLSLSRNIDFIKLDTQGYDLDILKGGEKTLESVCGLEVEVEFSTLYDKQPLFSDVDQYLRGLGFSLFDLRPCYWKRNSIPRAGRGQIIFGDALYFKDYISLNTVPVNLAPIVISAIIYKKYDFVVELINYFYKKGSLSFENKERIESVILSLGKTMLSIPHFKGKTMVIKWLENVLARLKSASWARYDSWR